VSGDNNADLLRRGFEAFERDGIDALLEYIHPDFEGIASPELATEPGVYRGHEGVRQWFAGFEGFMDDVHFEPDEFLAAGDRVLVGARLVARGMGSGIVVEQKNFQVWTFRDGTAIRLETYADMESARAAAGM
jgi:uncharacterized protein